MSTQRWSNWKQFFQEIIKGRKTHTLINTTVDKVDSEWQKYRLEDLIKTSPYSLSIRKTQKGHCEVKLACHCCGRLYEGKK